MQQLRNQLKEAQSNGVAVGHFNISDWILLKAVCAAAQELKVSVIVGASEAERAFLGAAQIAALVRSLREEQSIPIFLNADHTHSRRGRIGQTGCSGSIALIQSTNANIGAVKVAAVHADGHPLLWQRAASRSPGSKQTTQSEERCYESSSFPVRCTCDLRS
jgi:fructose/tagatose bisphosphate aldolase